MKSLHTEIEIAAAPDQVWKVLTKLTDYSSWNPFIIAAEGTVAKGNKLAVTMLNQGKKSTFRPKVTHFTPNQYFQWKGSLPIPGLFIGKHYFKLTKMENGHTKLDHGEHFGGLLSGMIMKKIGASTLAGFIAMNEALKKLVEKGG